jgi:anaerobic selenocysteine-containing dehydrogenase
MTIPANRIAAACAAALALAALGAGRVLAQANDLPEAPGKADVATTCTQCHGSDVIAARHRSPEEWADVVSRMKSMGAVIDPDKEKLIVAYLSTNLGTGAAPAAAPPAAAPATPGTTGTTGSDSATPPAAPPAPPPPPAPAPAPQK